MKIELLSIAWAGASLLMNAGATAITVARPDLVGALHFGAFAVGAGGLLSVLFHTPGEKHALRRLIAGTLLSGISGTAAGVAWSEMTGHGNIALVVAVGSSCLTVWGVSGRDVFALVKQLITLRSEVRKKDE